MSEHDWETTRCSRYVQRDECLRCGVRRVRGIGSGSILAWRYTRGGRTCTPQIDPSPAERAVMTEGRDG